MCVCAYERLQVFLAFGVKFSWPLVSQADCLLARVAGGSVDGVLPECVWVSGVPG